MISKLLLKLWFSSYDCFNPPLFSSTVWRGTRGCFAAAGDQSEKNKLSLPPAKFRNALQQVFPYSLLVYSIVKDDKQKEQSPNKVGEKVSIFRCFSKTSIIA